MHSLKVVTELVEYASSMYEKQSKLHTMKKLRSEQAWFLRGVLTYRKPYRSIASEAVDARDYECSLCYRLFWQPVVTACGHTYCKVRASHYRRNGRLPYVRLFFGHFEKNSRPKKLKPKKTQANFSKNSSK